MNANTTLWALGGHAHGAPDHTMVALWGALGAGADGLAVWVQQTSDGVVVVAPPSFDCSSSTWEEVCNHDAGAAFHARTLDEAHRVVDIHEEAPWTERPGRPNAATYPSLEHAFVHLSRRTGWLLRLHAPTANDLEALSASVDALLTRFAIRDSVVLSAPLRNLAVLPTEVRRAAEDDLELSVAEALEAVRAAGGSEWVAAATRALAPGDDGIVRWVLPDADHLAPTPPQLASVHARGEAWPLLAAAVDEAHASLHPRGTIVKDTFPGPEVHPDRWATGMSRRNDDTQLTVSEGLHFRIRGSEYSGAAAFSTFSVFGEFDARMRYEVSNPANGTTFELAVVHVDAGYHRPNLTFDVHGAPPYASSERDEDDGFRIGWNNGPALTRWRDGQPQSSNLYNNYSRDVGRGPRSRPAGELRLTRRGDVFNAYYRDVANPAWVLSGSALVPALADSVFFRLGAKHWPKGENPAPDNDVTLNDFELLQW